MNAAQQKVVQYLNEAHATEQALARVLQSQIAMTPDGDYRSSLERHLEETEDHAARVGRRISELDGGGNPLLAVVGVAETVVGQAIALAKTPLDLVRGTGGEEKVLKNAKDTASTEALEIATYTALERLAQDVGDETTADLARSIREDEQGMLDRVLELIPALTDAVAAADIGGEHSFDVRSTGAAQAARSTARSAQRGGKRAAAKASSGARRGARQARKAPGIARAEGTAKGAAASEGDLPIADYDDLKATEVRGQLDDLSKTDLSKVETYERKNANRTTVIDRISTLRSDD